MVTASSRTATCAAAGETAPSPRARTSGTGGRATRSIRTIAHKVAARERGGIRKALARRARNRDNPGLHAQALLREVTRAARHPARRDRLRHPDHLLPVRARNRLGAAAPDQDERGFLP